MKDYTIATCVRQTLIGHYYEEECIGWEPDEVEGAEFAFCRGSESLYDGLTLRGAVNQYEVGRQYRLTWHHENEEVRVRQRDVLDKAEEVGG